MIYREFITSGRSKGVFRWSLKRRQSCCKSYCSSSSTGELGPVQEHEFFRKFHEIGRFFYPLFGICNWFETVKLLYFQFWETFGICNWFVAVNSGLILNEVLNEIWSCLLNRELLAGKASCFACTVCGVVVDHPCPVDFWLPAKRLIY